MTLIAAFKSPGGFALCADSQETIGDHRKSVSKLRLRQCGVVDLTVAGTGSNGYLIDAFTLRLLDNVSTSEFCSLLELKTFIEKELTDFQNNEASAYELDMQFIIAGRMRNEPRYIAWQTTATRLDEIRSFALIGWDEPLYCALAGRLYREDLTLEQAELAAMYILTIAEETSNYVRGPMAMAIVRNSEMRLETPDRVRQMGDRLREFESAINSLLLACAENTPHPQFERELDRFRETATKLHKFQGLMVSKAVAYAVLVPATEPKPPTPSEEQ